MSDLLAPISGTVVALSDIPDPVFAAGALGDGLAIRPAEDGATVDVVAPVSGKALRVMPHAFLILTDSGQGVLVHIGIDTVQLRGEGFVVHTHQGAHVSAGQKMVTYSPLNIRQQGYDPICPCVLTDTRLGTISSPASGAVQHLAPLFSYK